MSNWNDNSKPFRQRRVVQVLCLLFGLAAFLLMRPDVALAQNPFAEPPTTVTMRYGLGLKFEDLPEGGVTVTLAGSHRICTANKRLISRAEIRVLEKGGFWIVGVQSLTASNRTCLEVTPSSISKMCKSGDKACTRDTPILQVTIESPQNRAIEVSERVVFPGGVDANGCGRTFLTSREICFERGEVFERADAVGGEIQFKPYPDTYTGPQCGALIFGSREKPSTMYVPPGPPLWNQYLCYPGEVSVSGTVFVSKPGPLSVQTIE